jgi:ribonuclease PH
MRPDNRQPNELRPLSYELSPSPYAEGSIIFSFGKTKVHCTASVEERVPPHRKESGGGWVTAEYAMLPRATNTRNNREGKNNQSGRSMEIQRLIGRSLRAVCNIDLLGPRQITVDCDVLVADGGTRTASITGGYIALALAVNKLIKAGKITKNPMLDSVQAISAGIIKGEARLDLCYEEDSAAEVDLNIVLTGSGGLVEIQGTAEGKPFSREQLNQMIDLGTKGCKELAELQKKILSA